MSVLGIIPARLQSTRLPRKMLLAETGKTLLQHTYEAASQSKQLSALWIATDSTEIAEAATSFQAHCVLTGDHPSGTDRIAEVVKQASADYDLIVNIQGDEPELDPHCIDKLIALMQEHPEAEMGTLGTPFKHWEQVQSPNCVKIALATRVPKKNELCVTHSTADLNIQQGRALYFSRAVIPHCRDGNAAEILDSLHPWYLHLGIYAYRRDFLLHLTELAPSRLELLEKLEQLRALEVGACIQVAIVPEHTVGIDTPADYAAFVARQQRN